MNQPTNFKADFSFYNAKYWCPCKLKGKLMYFICTIISFIALKLISPKPNYFSCTQPPNQLQKLCKNKFNLVIGYMYLQGIWTLFVMLQHQQQFVIILWNVSRNLPKHHLIHLKSNHVHLKQCRKSVQDFKSIHFTTKF